MDWYLRKTPLSPHILYKKPKSPVKDNQAMADEESSRPHLTYSCVGSYLGSLHFRFYISEMGRRNRGFLLDLAFVRVRQ